MSLLPPPASWPEQLADALKVRLAGITLTEPDPTDPALRRYTYAPASVARVDDFKIGYLRSDLQTQYLVRLGNDRPTTRTTGSRDRELEAWVLAAHRPDTPPGSNPHASSSGPVIEQAQNALARDIEIRLQEDQRLGGFAHQVDVTDVGRDFELEETFKWAVVELRVVILYRYPRGTA